ncbi:Type 1 glutamine amidotransferase-like domain-containing protein [Variovorax sp. ZT4R33]|uniref:Type 1 glutamine amidotransferase-like domain-containing protein n=1 Tax=Variovorax sp. ZT4R33 TaxID=3443743 RepID=UPI003F47789B
MNRRGLIRSVALAAVAPSIARVGYAAQPSAAKRRLIAFGSGNFSVFLKHIVPLIGKSNPKVCLIPTAAGDSLVNITSWYAACEELPMRAYVMKSFISSYTSKQRFEDYLLGMDAVFVGGGNTLNMLAVWKAQGIDLALRKAYESGVLMTGGSAGSLCWFESGTSDSRPIALSPIDGMAWLKGSHCPHFNAEASRRPLYHKLIKERVMPAGYACDNLAGVYFEDEAFIRSVAADNNSFSYHVGLVDGEVVERRLDTVILS